MSLLDSAGLLVVPAMGLVLLVLAGAGASAALGRRFPADAQAALAPVVGAALLALVSVLLPLGVPALPLAGAAAVLGAATTVVLRHRVALVLRASAWPLLVAVAAVALAAAPALARGDWRASSLYGSTDAYHWTSQARAYLDGPADPPVADHPDRLTYERSQSQHWAVAVPFGLLTTAQLTGTDPAEIYGAFSALLFALLPLATYAAARALLGWGPAPAAAAGLALALNAALLFASHFSWQQQVAGTAFAFGAAAFLRLGLEPAGGARELVLAAGLAAAAVASYRLGFAPYLAAVLAAVALAYLVTRRRDRAELRRAARATGAFGIAFALLAAPSLVALARGLPDFAASGGFSTAFKEAFPGGQLAEGLGLVPRVWTVEEGWSAAARNVWLAVATVVALGVLFAGARAIRHANVPRADFLVAGALLVVVGWAVLSLPAFAPYLSFKLLSYGAPFLVLVTLAPLAHGRAAPALAALALAVPSAIVATAAATDAARSPGPLAALPAHALPRDAVVAVEVDDPWEQAWALYYLREHRVSVERPSFLLTAQGLERDPSVYRHRPVSHRLVRAPAGETIWRREDLALVRVS